jgi:hypothetical protein
MHHKSGVHKSWCLCSVLWASWDRNRNRNGCFVLSPSIGIRESCAFNSPRPPGIRAPHETWIRRGRWWTRSPWRCAMPIEPMPWDIWCWFASSYVSIGHGCVYIHLFRSITESMAKTIGKPIAQANSSYVNQRTTGVSYSIQISFTWTLGYVYADWSPPLSDLNFARTNLHRLLLVVLILPPARITRPLSIL